MGEAAYERVLMRHNVKTIAATLANLFEGDPIDEIDIQAAPRTHVTEQKKGIPPHCATAVACEPPEWKFPSTTDDTAN